MELFLTNVFTYDWFSQVLAVIEELSKRRALTSALSGRDEETLEPILAFTVRYISDPKYSPTLIGVSRELCRIYQRVIGQSAIIDELFQKLKNHVSREIKVQKGLNKLIGSIDMVLASKKQEMNNYGNDGEDEEV